MEKKIKLNLETSLIISIVILSITFIGLVIALIIRNNKTPEATPVITTTTTTTYSNVEDDADADDSVTTRQFNSALQKDILTFINTVGQYQSNNRGAIPTTDDEWNSFKRKYLETEFTNKYSFVYCDHNQGNCTLPTALTWAKDANIIYVALHASCENNSSLVLDSSKRKLSAYTHLKGETNGTYCMNN
jgi:hypothetical protein